MKNPVKLFRIIALWSIIGGIYTACPEPDPGLPALSGTVSISGTAQVGQTLTANTSSLSGNGTISYQWKRGGDSTIGTNSITYTVQTADIGSTITVTVIVPGYSGSVISTPTAMVRAAPALDFTLISNGTAYSVSQGTITDTVVIIPAVYNGLPVTAIADSGFTSYTAMTSIIMPSGVMNIGNYAFFNCSNLISVTILDGVTSIGNFAFSGCGNLASVYYGGMGSAQWATVSVGSNNAPLAAANRYYYAETVPAILDTHWRFVDGVPAVWESTPGLAFTLINNNTAYSVSRGNVSVAEVVIPATHAGRPVTMIANSGFSGYTIMTSVTIPDSVTSIEQGAFRGCSGLTNMTIPFVGQNLNGDTNTHFGWIFGASRYWNQSESIPVSLRTVIITGGDNIGDYAFSGCSDLTSVTIPGSVTSIGFSAFWTCSGLTSVTIPGSVTSIGSSAFGHCSSLTSVTIGNGVTSISSSAFSDCSGLTSVTIPDSVTSIGSSAFVYCSSLTSVTIGNGVTSISDYAFGNCYRLTSIIMQGVNPPTTSTTRFPFPPNTVLFVPSTAVATYKKSWGINLVFSIDIIDTINTISDLIIINNVLIRYLGTGGSVAIPTGVESIGENVFRDCHSLTRVTIPDSVTSIYSSAFKDCSSLTSVTIPDSVVYIGEYVFENCIGLTSVMIPDSVAYIGPASFRGCHSLMSVTIQGSMMSVIGGSMFENCSGLMSVTIGSGVTYIGLQVFRGCSGLISINVDTKNQNFASQDGVLYNKGITEILAVPGGRTGNFSIPDSVTSIGSSAFMGCSSLTSVTIGNGVTSIGAWAFSNCIDLTIVTIPSSVTSIDNQAFSFFTAAQTIHIPFATIAAADAAWNSNWRNNSNAVIRNNAGIQVWP